jgi:hypothetical protein
MDAMDAAEVLRAMVRMFQTGDTTDVESVVSRAYVDHQGLMGDVLGIDGFCNVVNAARRSLGSLSVSIEDGFGERDRAVARLRWRGEDATGAVVERETIDIIRVVRGLAVEHWGAECWSRSSGLRDSST